MDPSPTACPLCRESISPEARVCPHCRSSALVDVVLQKAVADGKLRYQAARSLVLLAGGTASLTGLQAALGSARAHLLSGVTPGTGAAAEATLRELGIETRQEPASTAPAAGAGLARPAGRRVPLAPIAAGLALALAIAVGGGALLWRRGSSTKPTATAASATPATSAAPKLSGRELAERGLAATVALRCANISGAGFFVAPGLLLTNAHVVCPGEKLEVRLADGRQGSGSATRVDQELDLALVAVEGVEGRPLALGDAGSLRVGDRVAVVGNPLGFDFSVSQGSVSSLDRPLLGVAYIQTDAPVNAGNSGGPMLDEWGRAVGVVSMKGTGAEGIGLVLPINYAYSGQEPMLAAPSTPSSGDFPQMVERAQAADKRLADQIVTAGLKPGLVAAGVSGNQIAVQVLWPSSGDPGRQHFSFHFWSQGDRVCDLEGDAGEWRKVEGAGGEAVVPPRVEAWLQKHGLSSTLYVTTISMSWAHCPADRLGPGSELELEGADPAAARIRF